MDKRLETRIMEAALRLDDALPFKELCAEAGADPLVVAPALTRMAARYWDCWGLDAMDFCVQHTSLEVVIFGGSARVVWHPKTGFSLDAKCCSRPFTEHFDEIGPQVMETKQLLEPLPEVNGSGVGRYRFAQPANIARRAAHLSQTERGTSL